MTDIQISIKTFKIGQILQKEICNIWERFRNHNFSKNCVGRTTNFEAKVQNYFKCFSYFYVISKSLNFANLLGIFQKVINVEVYSNSNREKFKVT